MSWRGTFWTLLLAAVVAWFSGCGQVTESPEQQPDAIAPELAPVDGGRDASVLETTADAGAAPELAPVSCLAAGCASCALDGPAGPGFRTAATCLAVVSCVRAGGQGDFPWQSCANMHASSLAAGGLACAQQLDKACP